MTTGHQIRKLRCPSCGWERNVQVPFEEDEDLAQVAAGWRDLFIVGGNRQARAGDDLDEANNWIDIPCPHCGQIYQLNKRTGEVRQ